MKENDIYAKKFYKCGICEKTYETIKERSNCEVACIKRQKEEEARLAKEKLQAEKDARCVDASNALDKAFDAVNQYIKDYGSFQYKGKIKELNDMNMDYFPSRLWHHFWF